MKEFVELPKTISEDLNTIPQPETSQMSAIGIETAFKIKELGKDVLGTSSWSNVFTEPKKVELGRTISVNSDAYTEVARGKYEAKYPVYYLGKDNENLYAQQQGSLSRLGNGVWKNTQKWGLYTASAISGDFSNIINLMKGQSDALLNDTDFTRWVDEYTKKLDYRLPNYVSQEEKDMSLIRQMATINFWANDVGQGIAFMGAALLKEAAYAALTGGSGLALRGGMLGLRGMSFISKSGALTKSAKSIVKNYSRTVSSNKAISALNNARFLYTSTNFEASLEARQGLDESLKNVEESYKQKLGRTPTLEEYKELMPQLVSNANKVYAANVAVVGLSTITQFGSLFGVNLGVGKGVSALGKKHLLGLGTKRNLDGTLSVMKPSTIQKGAGRIFNFAKNPIVEGWEEGSQGFINKFSDNHIMSMFDPEANKATYSNMKNTLDSFHEAFGTKEGFKEVLIGMVIGKFGDGISAVKNKSFNTYKKEYEQLEEGVKIRNEAFNNYNTASENLIKRQLQLNQQLSSLEESALQESKGKLVEAGLAYEAAKRSFFFQNAQLGILEDSVEDFRLGMSQLDSESIAEIYGVNPSEVKNIKVQLLQKLEKDVSDFNKVMEVTSAYLPEMEIRDGNNLKTIHFANELSSALYLGLKSSEMMDSLGMEIEEALGKTGFANLLSYYAALDTKEKELVSSINNISKSIKRVDTNYANLQQEYSSLLEQQARQKENTDLVKRIESNRKKAAELQEERQKLEAESVEVKNKLGKKPKRTSFLYSDIVDEEFITPEKLADIETQLEELDAYVEELETTNAEAANSLRYLMEEYMKAQKALEAMHRVTSRLQDYKYNFQKYKGITRFFKGSKVFSEPRPDKPLSPNKLALEKFILDNNLDEYEAFNLRMYQELNEAMEIEDSISLLDMDGSIDVETWKTFKETGEVSDEVYNDLAEKIFNGDTLLPKEQQIVDAAKAKVDDLVSDIKKREGDSVSKLRNRFLPKKSANLINNIDILRDLINQFFNNRKSLSKMSRQDIKQEDIPTEDEYREYTKLKNKLRKNGTLPKNKLNSYKTLKDKIDNWGLIEGTTANGIRLSDLYEQLFVLEEEAFKNSNVDNASGVEVEEVLDASELEDAPTRRDYAILQGYDKVFFSKYKDEEGKPHTVIHNTSLANFVEILIKKTPGVRIQQGKNKVDTELENLDREKITYIVFQDAAGVEQQITIFPNVGGTLRIPDSQLENFNYFDSIILITERDSKGFVGNYFTVMVKLEDGSVVNLDSDFFEENYSVENIHNKRAGDEVEISSIQLNDPYNIALINKFRRNEITREDLMRSIKIRVTDREGNLIGVVKEIRPNSDPLIASNLEEIRKVREQVVEAIFDQATDELNNIVKDFTNIEVIVDIPLSIKTVFLGHPIMKMSINEAGMMEVELSPITEPHLDKISDIGYIENGQLVTKNKLNKKDATTTYVNGVLSNRNNKYTNQRIPVVVLNINGRKVVYPVTLRQTQIDLSAEVDTILSSPITNTEKAIAINRLLKENNIDPNVNGVLDSTVAKKADDIKALLSNIVSNNPIEDWVKDDSNMEQILLEDVFINLDLDSSMFHSPKVHLNFGEQIEEDPLLEDEEVSVEEQSTSIESVEQVIENNTKLASELEVDDVVSHLGQIYRVVEVITNIDGTVDTVNAVNVTTGLPQNLKNVLKTPTWTFITLNKDDYAEVPSKPAEDIQTEEETFEQAKERISKIKNAKDRVAAEVELIMKNLFKGVGENAANKIKEYADRILSGRQTREQVIEGLTESFITAIDSLVSAQRNQTSTVNQTKEIVDETPKDGDIIVLTEELQLFKGLKPKLNADGTIRTAHPGAEGKFFAEDLDLARQYAEDDSDIIDFVLPVGTEIEVVRVWENSPKTTSTEIRRREVERINTSKTTVVKMITYDANAKFEAHYVLKNNYTVNGKPLSIPELKSKPAIVEEIEVVAQEIETNIQENEKTEQISPGQTMLEGVSEARDENKGREESEQLRPEESQEVISKEEAPLENITSDETTTRPETTPEETGTNNETPTFTEYGTDIIPEFSDTTTDGDKEKLKPHQQKGVNAIVNAIEKGFKGFLLADGAGAGKTRQLIVAAKKLAERGKKVLIITENKAIISGSFQADSKDLGYNFRLNKDESATVEGIDIVTVNSFTSKINPAEYDVIITDESQKLSGLTSKGGTKLRSFNGQVVFSSATPFDTVNKMMYIIPRLFNMSEQQFLNEIGARIDSRPGRDSEIVFTNNNTTKFVAFMNKLHTKLLSEGKMLHRRYEFFGNDSLELEVSGEDTFGTGLSLDEAIEGIENYYKLRTKNIILTDYEVRRGITEEEKKRQLNERKVNELNTIVETYKASTELLDEVSRIISEGGQVVIYGSKVSEQLNFHYAELEEESDNSREYTRPSFIIQMSAMLRSKGIEFGTITGDTKDKSSVVRNFQDGKTKVVIVNQSGTTGINLNDVKGSAPRTLFIAGTLPNAIQLEQLKGRVSRLNNKSKANVVYVNTKSTAENKNQQKRLQKLALMNAILVGEEVEVLNETTQIENPRAQDTVSLLPTDIRIETVGRAFILTGKGTYAMKDRIKAIGGKWFKNRNMSGWMFPLSIQSQVLEQLGLSGLVDSNRQTAPELLPQNTEEKAQEVELQKQLEEERILNEMQDQVEQTPEAAEFKEEVGDVKGKLKSAFRTYLNNGTDSVIEKFGNIKNIVLDAVSKFKKAILTILIIATTYIPITSFKGISESYISNTILAEIQAVPDYIKRGLWKFNLLDVQEETTQDLKEQVVSFDSTQNIVSLPESKIQQTVKEERDGIGELSVHSNFFDAEKGFNYNPIPTKGNFKVPSQVDGKAVAHFFILDGRPADFKDIYEADEAELMRQSEWFKNKSGLFSGDSTKIFPVFKKLPNGQINLTYKQKKDIKKEDVVIQKLVQYKVNEIDWNVDRKVDASSQYSKIRDAKDKYTLQTVTGQEVPSVVFSSRKAYSKFSGAAGVLVAKGRDGKMYAKDFSGSVENMIDGIKNFSEIIGVDANEITLAFFDAGSVTAKPVGKNNKLNRKDWYNYNNKKFSGSGLAFPVSFGEKQLPPQINTVVPKEINSTFVAPKIPTSVKNMSETEQNKKCN